MEHALTYLQQLRGVVDTQAQALEHEHRNALQCRRGCHDCCVDDLTVFDLEAEAIRRAYPEVLQDAPHPPGRCAFLSPEGACRVYDARPYVCRTQGLPLRWLDFEDPEPVERRDICPKNIAVGPLAVLPPEHCWSLGPVEERLRTAQHAVDGGIGRRVALRDLFTVAPEDLPPEP